MKKAHPSRFTFDDGILKGYIGNKLDYCAHCHLQTTCIHFRPSFHHALKDKGIDSYATTLRRNYDAISNAIGIGCGCYAKFHRQVAHIEDAMKRKQ